jgi:arylsulfatase A-like enzyme
VAKTVDEPVRSLDVMPTLLELVDAPLPRQIQGRSLVPCLDGPLPPVPVVSETVMRWDTPVRGDTEGWIPVDFHRAVRDGRFTWVQRVVDSKSDREALYDVVDDPGEKKDLLARDDLKEKLEELRRLASSHEAWCRRLAAEFESGGGTPVQLSEEQQRSLEALGYVK